MTDSEILKIRDEVINNAPAGTLAWEIDILVGRALLERTTGTHESECPWDVIGFANAIRNAEISSLRFAEALLAAEKAREKRNREHVRLNAEWMAKCEEARKERDHYQMAAEAEAKFADEFREKAEELRKDAARYRWLREQNWKEADIAVVCDPKKSVKLGFDCPSGQRLDDAIDAATIKNEQSHGL